MTFQPPAAAFAGLLAELPRSPVFRVRIDNIDLSDRLRPVDPAHAQVLADRSRCLASSRPLSSGATAPRRQPSSWLSVRIASPVAC